jgi:C1A family cysteine protease
VSRYGCLPDIKDHNDRPFTMTASQTQTYALLLPPVMDLRPWCPPVMNQVSLGSCTAHGVTAALRFNLINNGQPDIPLSRLQLYYDSRASEGTTASDAGAQIRNVIKTAAAKGVGKEELWSYDLTKWAVPPPPEVYTDAVNHEAIEYSRVEVSAHGLKLALFTGRPVVIGITVHASFESDQVATTGVVPMPGPGENVIAGHCMLVAGYGQMPGYFTVLNSWGEGWGDKGYCYIPEAYLGSAKYGSDYWSIYSTTGANPP